MDAITREILRSYGEDVSVPGSSAVTVQRGRYGVNVNPVHGEYEVLFMEKDNEVMLVDIYTSETDMLQECREWLEVE